MSFRGDFLTKTYITHSGEQTERLGFDLAHDLVLAPAVALFGGLGAGKTTFTRGLVRGLGCTEDAKSPTYTIVNEYPGRYPVCHFDMYRLNGSEDLYDIGWQDYIASGALLVVEWSERAEDALPRGTVRIYFESDGPDARKVTVHYDDSCA